MVYRLLLLLAVVSLLSGEEPGRAPVLVELFTSEGCSSCPPADALLTQLDSRAIVLGEHVDYWDHLGWRDVFDSHANTLRQEGYGRQFGLHGVYTPQMVVDGVAEFTGSDAGRARAEIDRAAQRKKAVIQLKRTAAGVEVTVEGPPRQTDVYFAIADEGAESQVAAGENKGRRLRHTAIARSIRKIGVARREQGFHTTIEAPAGSRTVVFLQSGGLGEVYGAAVLPGTLP